VRDRVFFEDRFVLWPLQQVLDQSDRYGVVLCDKDEARLFLFYLEAIEEVLDVVDEIAGRIRFPDPYRELEYMRKNIEYIKHYFDNVAERALRLLQKEPFEHPKRFRTRLTNPATSATGKMRRYTRST
jgi:Bacterial archaeo-eukaryotic release factor family 10